MQQPPPLARGACASPSARPFTPFTPLTVFEWPCTPLVAPLRLSSLNASVASRDLTSALPGTSRPGLRCRVSSVQTVSFLCAKTHVKEGGRLEVYAKDLDRHNRPVFRPRNVRHAEARPGDNISSLLTHFCRPKSSPPGFWLMCTSEGNSSSALYCVTNIYSSALILTAPISIGRLTLCLAKGARFHTNDPGLASNGGMSLLMILYPTLPPVQ